MHQIFPEQDPAVLLDIYNQVGKDKNILMETVLNGGVLPEQLASSLNQRQEPDDIYLNNLVGMGDNPQANEEILRRQMEMMGQGGTGNVEHDQ